MSKVIDITDKLAFDENPVLKIRDVEIEINTDATTMLKVMGLFKNGKSDIESSLEAARLVMGEDGMKIVEEMKLSFQDFMSVIHEAVDVAIGKEDSEGEE